jgi:hypothetical protein
MEHDFEREFRRRTRRERHTAGAIPGLILVGIGALFFLNNLHIIYVREWVAYWPVILIAGGIVKLVDANFTEGRVVGGFLLSVGLIFLGQSLGYIELRLRDLWPLILIGLGLMMLFQRVHWYVRVPDQAIGGFHSHAADSADTVRIDAVFGGGKRIVTTQNFQGGPVSALFGGVELDLRQAGMIADSAVVEVNAIFGGVEIKVPRNWSVVMQGMGIFGGYSDSTLQPDPREPGVKKLIVKGGAVFGGVEVKN